MAVEPPAGGALTWRECVELLDRLAPARVASVSIGSADPVAMACFLFPAAEVVIPTGADRDLVRVAVGRPVTVTFERSDPDSGRRWVVRGTGRAQPLAHRRPPAAVDNNTALAMLHAFENGIRVRFEEIAGQWMTQSDASRVARS